MGTNYYVYLRDKDEWVHIGKHSTGWSFLFAQNLAYYENTKVSVNRFLKLHKNEFYDEYGELQDINEFWEMVENTSSGYNLMSYLKFEQEVEGRDISQSEWNRAKREIISEDGCNLIFTPNPDFS
jgi:hypothetical protein